MDSAASTPEAAPHATGGVNSLSLGRTAKHGLYLNVATDGSKSLEYVRDGGGSTVEFTKEDGTVASMATVLYLATRRPLKGADFKAVVGVAREMVAENDRGQEFGCYVGDLKANGAPVLFMTESQYRDGGSRFHDESIVSGIDEVGNLIVAGDGYDTVFGITEDDLRRVSQYVPLGRSAHRLRPYDDGTHVTVDKIKPVTILTEDGPVKAFPMVQDAFEFRLSEKPKATPRA